MKVYLCGGINKLSDADAKDWRETAKSMLHATGIETLDPMRRDYRGREGESGVAAEIVYGDLRDILDSRVVLVNASRPSWGTAMELFYASTLGETEHRPKPLVVAFGAGESPSPWLSHHCVLYSDIESACRAVIDFHKLTRGRS